MCLRVLPLLVVSVLGAASGSQSKDGVVVEDQTAGWTAPEILEEPTEEIVRRNDPLTLYCNAAGDPTPRILWYRTDSDTPLRDRDSRLQLQDGSLFFYRVRGRDRGTYYCVARSPAGTATSRRVTVEMAYLRENFRKSPSSLGVNEGETAVFECDPPKGHPIPVVTWRLDGQALVLPRHRYRQEGTTLIVSHVIPADEGEYQCVVTNMAGQRVSRAANLTVFESARVGGVVKSMVGVAGHDVTLPCSPSGTPKPQVLWRRADGLMPVGRADVGRDWGLTISSVRINDQGVYVCEASNTAGAHAANTTLLVVERPRVEGGVRPRIAVITPTHVRKISCPVTATPTPIVFWVKENHDRQVAERVVEKHHLAGGGGGGGSGAPSYELGREAPQLVIYDDGGAGGGGGSGGGLRAMVDQDNSLHVSTHQEGLWACMATNEVGGLVMPVRVVGGGVARGTVGVGMVGVDEVEARASLLTPTLEQGYPASTTPTTATVTWRLRGRPTHMEGIFILGCERGSGLVTPRIHQQLQTHDISLHHHYKYYSKRRASLPHLAASTTTLAHSEYGDGSRISRQHPDAAVARGEMTSLKHSGDPGSTSTRQVNSTLEDGLVWGSSPTPSPPPPQPSPPPAPPRCTNLRVLGHSPAPGRLTYHLHGLQPYTSYWFLLLPHYKGVLGVPSNLHAFTTPQDVPSGWAVLSRWWAARVGAGLYALTLHWRPLPPHLAHGVILNYLITVKESDTGLVHNVTVVGDLTTLTLPNVTSSRVEVSFTASTVRGPGPSSPPARLNLLMTHFKDPGVGVGVVRSAWFLVLAGGAVAMVVVLVGCTVAARWCARSIHHPLPSELSKGKVCSVGGPWVEVGGLWTPVPTHDLNSDKSERKLLTSNGSSSAAEYAEVEVGSQVKEELTKKRLEPWPQGYLCPSPSPSTASSTQRTTHITQSESLPSRPARSQGGPPAGVVRQHTAGSSYTSPPPHTGSSTCRDSDTSTWYTGECCSCCREDVKLPVPHDSFSATPSGCSTVLHVNLDRGDLQAYSSAMEYQYSGLGTDAYETVTPYDEATTMTSEQVHRESSPRCPLPPSRQDLRHLRLNTESTTDLSMDCYNFSDDDDDDDITQSCSDTEASFFIPHHRKPESSDREELRDTGLCDDLQRPASSLHRVAEYPRALRQLAEEEQSQNDQQSSTNSLKCPNQNTVSSSASNTSTSVSAASTMNPLATEDLETSSTRRASCRSSLSQDSLEEQFERTLNMIAQGGSSILDSDYLSTSAYN